MRSGFAIRFCDPVSAIRFHGTRTGNRIRAKIIVTIKNGGTFCSD